jgi:Xaa-Pro dipeptidase
MAHPNHMKDAKFPDFPREEYEGRWDRTRRILKAAGIDALLLSNQENLRYFAGFHEGAWCCKHFYFFMLLPADETIAPCLIFANLFQNLAKASWVKEAHYWPWPTEFYMSHETNAVPLIASVLDEKRLSDAVIGLEMGANMHHGLGAEHFDHLRAALSKSKIVNATNAIWEVRAIKSEAELDRLRRASAISCKGVKAGFEALKPGVSERQIASVMHEVMFAEGATETGLMCVYAGPRLMWADSTPSDYKIQKGDVIQFDGGCLYDGYWSDFKRMAAIGEPRPEQRRYFELATEGIEAALSVMKAGATSGQVFQAAFDVNDRAGHRAFSEWCLANGLRAIGHSIGLNIHEHPGLSYQSPLELKANMAFAVEPFITLNGHIPFQEAPEKYGLEDNVIVTSEGIEMMTREEYVTHELWIA